MDEMPSNFTLYPFLKIAPHRVVKDNSDIASDSRDFSQDYMETKISSECREFITFLKPVNHGVWFSSEKYFALLKNCRFLAYLSVIGDYKL
jgi:hypothetical protein